MPNLILFIVLLLDICISPQHAENLDSMESELSTEGSTERTLSLKSEDVIRVLTDEQNIPINIFSSVSSLSFTETTLKHNVCDCFFLAQLKFHDYLFWRAYRFGILPLTQDFIWCTVVLLFIAILLPILYATYKIEYPHDNIELNDGFSMSWKFKKVRQVFSILSYKGRSLYALPLNFNFSKMEVYPFPIANSLLKVFYNILYPFLLFGILMLIHGILVVYLMALFPLDSHAQMQYAASVIYSKSISFPNMVAKMVVNCILDLFMLKIDCNADPSWISFFLSLIWSAMWYILKSFLFYLLMDLESSSAFALLACIAILLSITTSTLKSRYYLTGMVEYAIGVSPSSMFIGILSIIVFFLMAGCFGIFEPNPLTNQKLVSFKYIVRAMVQLYYFVSREVKMSVSKFITIDFMKVMTRMNASSDGIQPILALEYFYAKARPMLLLLDICPKFLSSYLEEQ